MPDQRDSNRPSLDRSDGSAPLRVLQSYDPFGWIAKIGLVTPSTNTVTAPEWTMQRAPIASQRWDELSETRQGLL